MVSIVPLIIAPVLSTIIAFMFLSDNKVLNVIAVSLMLLIGTLYVILLAIDCYKEKIAPRISRKN
ncbi:hypothetical protein DW1_2085 [Proteiniborus sp. DW1]|uniref:hypothetical protein n=1 Tax=Proteiniborus sp. DW1 TaxID=1889883 RepID=UPI00092E0ECF|nr:hypothetical protein [Proteiniborus sp. DW1]SCG83651.1 hypothetical protein DW1_2085 [Proteiniborus sp. DW1]